MSEQPAWLVRARRFHADDPDVTTRAELTALLARAPTDHDVTRELQDRFSAPLAFGTAGLRGLLGAGDNRMNRRVVATTTAALCQRLLLTVPDAQKRGLCIGFDGRHKSLEFAEEVRAIANGAGFVVHAFETPAPTPLLAFAVLERGAAGGVMITASHNPAAYNGYKVYWSDGAQLNSPHDSAIAAHAEQLADQSVIGLPRLPLSAARQQGAWFSLQGTEARYLHALGLQLTAAVTGGDRAMTVRAPSVVYTALHGVGEHYARAAITQAGVSSLQSVAEQAEPHPDFPTLRFPNPEEAGTLDLLLALADREHAQLALANDPDADRLAVAARTRDGVMQPLTGNELGVLLCDYLLQQAPNDGKNLIVTTLVSTPLAAHIAHAHGAQLDTTLTGFKWIVRQALTRATAGFRLVLGFEEALGYCIGELVRDKDGVAAAAHVVRMTRWHAAHSCTLHQALEQLYRRHGLFHSAQSSLTGGNVTELQQRVAALRAAPPTRIADLSVRDYRDLLHPGAGALTLPRSDVLIFELEGQHRVTVRPSGTEPKLKIYTDCVAQLTEGEDIGARRLQLRELTERISNDLSSKLGF